MNKKILVLSSLLLSLSLVGCGGKTKDSTSINSNNNSTISDSGSSSQKVDSQDDNSNSVDSPSSNMTDSEKKDYNAYHMAIKSLTEYKDTYSYYGSRKTDVTVGENEPITTIDVKEGMYINTSENSKTYHYESIGTENSKTVNKRYDRVKIDDNNFSIMGIENIDSTAHYYSVNEDNFKYSYLSEMPKLISNCYTRIIAQNNFNKEISAVNNELKSDINLSTEFMISYDIESSHVINVSINGVPEDNTEQNEKFSYKEELRFYDGMLQNYNYYEKIEDTTTNKITETSIKYNVTLMSKNSSLKNNLSTDEIEQIKGMIKDFTVDQSEYWRPDTERYVDLYCYTIESVDRFLNDKYVGTYENRISIKIKNPIDSSLVDYSLSKLKEISDITTNKIMIILEINLD